MIRLYVTPDGHPPYLLSFERSHVTVGSAANSDVRLQGPGISGRHCMLRRVGVDVVLEDCNSRNGTYVNRQKVMSPKVLAVEDVIVVVGFQLRLVAEARPGSSPAAPETVRIAEPAVRGGDQRTRVAAPAPPHAGGADAHGAGAPLATLAPRPPAAASVSSEPGPDEAGRVGPRVELPPGLDLARVAGDVSQRAQAWNERADDTWLLGGEQLHAAHLWVQGGARVEPAATRREQAFVAASLQARRGARRRRVQIAAAWFISLFVGGWTAGRVLAGGPEAYVPGLSRWAAEVFQERWTSARRVRCLDESTAAAAAARGAASRDPEAALGQATAALRCVGELGDIGTPVERVVRDLLGESRSFVLDRGESPVSSVVGSDPRGRLAAWGREDGTIVVWSADRWSGATQSGDGAALHLLASSADGARLVAVADSGLVRVWDLRDEAAAPQRLTLDLAREDLGAAALSADGRRLAIASPSRPEIRAFDLDSSAARIPALRLAGLADPAERVLLSADGSQAFAASGATILRWRLGAARAGKPQVLAGHAAGVTAMSLVTCPDDQGEKWLASGDASGGVRLWELRGRGATALTGDGQGVRALRVTADCRELVAAGLRGLWVWDLRLRDPGQTPRVIQLGTLIQSIEIDRGRVLAAAGHKLHACELATGSCADFPGQIQTISAMSPPGPTGAVVTGSTDGTVRLWDVRATTGIQSVQGHHEAPTRAFVLGVEGRVLVAAGDDARLWRVDGVQPPRVLQTLVGQKSHPLRSVALSPSGLWAATAADTSELVLWQIGDERAVPIPAAVSTPGSMLHLDFSDDGAWLVGSGDAGACALAVQQSGLQRCSPFADNGEVYAQTFIAGTHRVVLASDNDVVLVDLDAVTRGSGAEQRLGRGKSLVRGLASSGDGRWLVALGEGSDGRLWDLRAQTPALELGSLGASQTTVAQFSPDKQWLVVGAGTKLLAWRLARPDTTPTVVRDKLNSSITALSFGQGNARLLTGFADGTVAAWDFAALGETVPVTLGKHPELVTQFVSLDDSSVAVSIGRDTTMHVWPLSPLRLWQLAERVRGGRGR